MPHGCDTLAQRGASWIGARNIACGNRVVGDYRAWGVLVCPSGPIKPTAGKWKNTGGLDRATLAAPLARLNHPASRGIQGTSNNDGFSAGRPPLRDDGHFSLLICPE
jgi:hypothetical protein